MASSNSLRKYLLPLQRARQRPKQPHHRRESESPALLMNISSQIIQTLQYVHKSIVALSKALHVENAWLCASFIANANFCTVHRHVPLAVHRRLPKVSSQFRSSRARTRCRRCCSWRACGAVSLRITWPAPQPEARCEVSHFVPVYLHCSFKP